jgi:glutathionylspermidine synthase
VDRLSITPRGDWRAHVERDLGFAFHTIGGAPYWDETVCYRLTTAEIDEIEAATEELSRWLALVDRVVQTGEQA